MNSPFNAFYKPAFSFKILNGIPVQSREAHSSMKCSSGFKKSNPLQYCFRSLSDIPFSRIPYFLMTSWEDSADSCSEPGSVLPGSHFPLFLKFSKNEPWLFFCRKYGGRHRNRGPHQCILLLRESFPHPPEQDEEFGFSFASSRYQGKCGIYRLRSR